VGEPDHVCQHGIAFDVHCCDCRRSGFFPPDDCTCYEEPARELEPREAFDAITEAFRRQIDGLEEQR